MPVCAHYLLSFHGATLRRVCLRLLPPAPKQVLAHTDNIPPTLKLSLTEAEQSRFAQPPLIWKKVHSLHRIHGPSLDPAQHIFLVLGSIDWAKCSGYGLRSAERRGRLISTWMPAHVDGPLLSLKEILQKSTIFPGPLFSSRPLC